MLTLSADDRLDKVLPFLEKAGWISAPDDDLRRYVAAILAAAGDRIKAAGDILDYRDFFTADEELEFDEKAFDKRLRKPQEATVLLDQFRSRLAETPLFEADPLEQMMRTFVDEQDIKLGQIIHAVRVAVTGKAVGFGLFEILEILGRERVLERIDRALSLIEGD